jgi:hypothetical protein
MNAGATRVALVVFVIGALGVWLITPIGNACPDIGKLPAGSRSSSAPSFMPPLTRSCTYTTAGGIEAHQRYVPIVDWIVLGVLAGVVGLGVALLGGSGPQSAAGRTAEPDGPPDWLADPEPPARPAAPTPPPAPAPRPAPATRPAPAPRTKPATRAEPVLRPAPGPPEPSPDGESEAAARAAQRELERQQRARRRGRS